MSWRSEQNPKFSVLDGDDYIIAECSREDHARLMAAAPELLAELKTAAIITPHNRFNARSLCDPLCACCRFDAAIAKAEGRDA